MRDHPVRMRKPPRRERIRRETLMDERQRRFEARVLQVLVVAGELPDEDHALVDDGAAGHRHRIVFGDAFDRCGLDAIGGDLANDIELALEIVLVDDIRAAANEELTLRRLRRLDGFAKVAVVDRRVAPTDESLAAFDDSLLENLLACRARLLVARHEELADRILAGRRQGHAELGAFLGEEAMRNLNQSSAAVAKLWIGACRAAMVQVDEDLEAFEQNVMRLAVLEVGDKADAAGIMFVTRIIKSLGGRQGGIDHRSGSKKGR